MKWYLASLFFLCIIFYTITGHSQRIRVIAYNIHHGCDTSEKLQLQNIARLIKKSKAEIVGLVEVDSMCRRSGNTDQAKILGKLTGMHYAYVRHFSFDGGSYGLALLSKFKISDVTNARLPVSTGENGNTRAFLTAALHTGNKKEIVVGVAHFDYRSDSSRLRQSQIVTEMFKNEKDPVLLLGDLNATPSSTEIMSLTDLFTDTNSDTLLTYPAHRPEKKIDYILADKKHYLKTEKELVYPTNYSDHLAIFSSIILTGKDK